MRDPRGHLAERAQLLRAHQLVLGGRQLAVGARALFVQAHAAQRQRRQVRDVEQQPLVGLAERPGAAAQRDHAEHLLPRGHRHAEPLPQARRVLDRLDAVPHACRRVVVGPQRPVGREHHGHEADVAERIAARLARVVDAVGEPQDDLELVALGVTQDHHHIAGVQDTGDVTSHGLHDGAAIELTGDRAREIVQHRELLEPLAVFLEQAAVLERDAGLRGDRLDERDLVVRKLARALPPHGREGGDHAVFHDDRDEQLRAMPPVLAHRGRQPRVVRRVAREHGPLRASGLRVEGVLEQREAEPAKGVEPVGRDVIAGDRLHPLAVLLHEPGPDTVGAERRGDGFQEVAEQRLHVERGGQRAAHR